MMTNDESDQEGQTGLFSNMGIKAGAVAGSFLLLILIIVYIHFDAAITKFTEDTKHAIDSRINACKRYLRAKAMTADANVVNKAKIFAKMRMVGTLQVAAKKQQEEEIKRATSGFSISIISSNAHLVSKCESSSTVVVSEFNATDLGESTKVG